MERLGQLVKLEKGDELALLDSVVYVKPRRDTDLYRIASSTDENGRVLVRKCKLSYEKRNSLKWSVYNPNKSQTL